MIINNNLRQELSCPPGKIILLNGPSSAGKSTLCAAIQQLIGEPFLQFTLDHILFNGQVLPGRENESGPFSWSVMRPKVILGYFNSLAAMARAGNNVVADFILESIDQLRQLRAALQNLDVFFVGVHCPLQVLKRRETERRDRRIGDAERDFMITHSFSPYDFVINGILPVFENANAIVNAWYSRTGLVVFNAAYPAYAAESYHLQTFDYSFHPLTLKRLVNTINKPGVHFQLRQVLDPCAAPDHAPVFFVKAGKTRHKILLDEILYFEGQREYISIVTLKEKLLVYRRLKDIEQQMALPFIRVHNSFIINTRHLLKIRDNHLFIGDLRIPVSDKYRQAFLSVIDRMAF